MICIPPECDAAGAQEVHDRLCAETARADSAGPRLLDLGPGRPTAIALQLLMSAAATLRGQGAFAGFGPRAAAVLEGTGGDV